MSDTPAGSAADDLRAQILDLVREYHAQAFPPEQFIPGQSPVPVSGRVFDDDDLVKLVDSSLDFWLTTGRFAHEFEREFAKRMRRVVVGAAAINGTSAQEALLAAFAPPW